MGREGEWRSKERERGGAVNSVQIRGWKVLPVPVQGTCNSGSTMYRVDGY